jgi:glycosyltransferase involved in cell wall biosynthesis
MGIASTPSRDVIVPGAEPGHRALRVLYVSHTGAAGGCNGSLRHLIANLPAGVVDAHVACPDGPASAAFAAAGATVHRIPGTAMLMSIHGVPMRGARLLDLLRTAWHSQYGWSMRRLIRDIRPDLVHLNERGMFQAACIADAEGLPVVLHSRSVTDRSARWISRFSSWWIRRYVDRVISIDQSVQYSQRGIADSVVIYNPLDVSAVAGQDMPNPVDGVVRVTYLTGLLRFKGIWDLMEAARLLRDRSDIVFQVAGANSRPPAFHRSFVGRVSHRFGMAQDVEGPLRSFVRQHDLRQVRLLGHVDNLEGLLRETDILVFPSHLNGPGRSVFEAGARGIPSVVALEDRIEDIIEDGITGLIVRPHDPSHLCAAIARLADDPQLRARLGEGARAKYLPQFAPMQIGQQVFALYLDITRTRAALRSR